MTLGLVAYPVTLVTPHSARGQLETTSLHVACVLKGTIPAMVMLQEWVLDAYRVPWGTQLLQREHWELTTRFVGFVHKGISQVTVTLRGLIRGAMRVAQVIQHQARVLQVIVCLYALFVILDTIQVQALQLL